MALGPARPSCPSPRATHANVLLHRSFLVFSDGAFLLRRRFREIGQLVEHPLDCLGVLNYGCTDTTDGLGSLVSLNVTCPYLTEPP